MYVFTGFIVCIFTQAVFVLMCYNAFNMKLILNTHNLHIRECKNKDNNEIVVVINTCFKITVTTHIMPNVNYWKNELPMTG